MQTVQQATAGQAAPKPRTSVENINTKGPRPLTNIVPSSNIRPASTMTASSVSTQTGAGQLQNQVAKQGKLRGKPAVRACAPPATQKQDAANQTNKQPSAVKQP